jgi:cytochrome c-type biogenesis protein CcmH
MPELVVLLAGLAIAALLVVPPLVGAPPEPEADDERDAAAVRHRVAIESLRDVEADRRAGSLDDAAYAEQLAEAEARAATTRAALERIRPRASARSAATRSQRTGVLAAAAIGTALVVGAVVPGTGIANHTVVNQSLADAQATEADRQARIAALLDELAADPRDVDVLSDLADAYLEGASTDDLVRAAVALRVLIELEPDRADAYERIIAAYLRAGDAANARAAHGTYAGLPSADPIEVAFLDGLIALRGEGDMAVALSAFDRFLELAPDDPRAGMVRVLREEALDR